MKIELNEETLNAYISEAIKQELNQELDEGILGKIGDIAKRGAKKYFKNMAGNKKALKDLQGEYDNIIRKQQDLKNKAAQKMSKDAFGKGIEGYNALDAQRNATLKKMQALRNKSTLTRVGTAGLAGGIAGANL